MNILVIPSWYNNNINPTNGSFFREQAIELKKSGHQVYVLFVDVTLKKLSKEEKEIKFYIDEGVMTYRIKVSKLPKTGNIGTSLAIKKGLLRIFEHIKGKINFDIIHLHSCLWSGLGAVALSKKYDIPLVITEHSSYYKRRKFKGIDKAIVQHVINKSDKLICVSNALKESMINFGKEIEVIPNMVDCEYFFYDEKMLPKEFTFLSLCYLNANKRIDMLIQAFAHEFKGTNTKLIIGGDGPEREYLQGLSRELKVTNQIEFLGKLTREEAALAMRKCNVFVLPSKVETFGIVLIEAMASGKPVISTYNGGAEDIVSEKNGTLIKKDNYIYLAEAMSKIKENYNDFNPQEISYLCKNKYDNKVIEKKLEFVYNNVLFKSK